MEIQLSLPEVKQLLNLENHTPKRLDPVAMRQLLEDRGFVYPKQNIIFHCLKGGAAKTTLAYNSAFRLSQLGCRVLLVDLDKQSNATHSLSSGRPKHVFVDAVTGRCPVEDLVQNIGTYLDLIPSSLENARLEMELINRKKNPRTYYKNIFAPLRDNYDVVILDLPPDLSHNTYLSSLFADIICIPTNPDEYSVHGTRLTLGSLVGLKEEYPDLDPRIMVVWSKFDAREKQSLHYLSEFQTEKDFEVLPNVIRIDVSFKNAQSRKLSVFQLPRKTSAREDIDCLARSLIHFPEIDKAKGAVS